MTPEASSKLIDALGRVLPRWAPPAKLTPAQWIEAHMRLPDTSAIAGRYSLAVTPYLREPLEALADPAVREVAGQKSSQIGWTMGLVMGWIGYTIDHDPTSMIVMFPRDKTARDFNIEKFEPVVEASPSLAEKITVKSRSRDYRQDHKTYAGGFCKLVGSNSPGAVKSTSAKRLIVEEPDDCNVNIKGQGDSIELLRDRGKTYADAKLLVGGTPTIKGVSSIEAELAKSDQREFFVPCHHCGDSAPLVWENVRWSTEEDAPAHPVYGRARPETARYVCPLCGGEWSSSEKNANVARAERDGGGWRPMAPFHGIRGYYFSELLSPFAESALDRLVGKYLAAKHEADQGKIGALIAFWNGTLGRPWEWKADVPEEDDLRDRALDYPEWTVPAGGLVLTAGLDVQHDRIAIVVRAWGRGEESWLVFWGELFGNVLEWEVWEAVWATIFARTYRTASGASINIAAASFDASDGQTDDAVYKAVREFNRRLGARRVMAIKGSSIDTREIFSKPRVIDVNHKHKAARYGLAIYMVGASRAKDLIVGGEGGGRLKLSGNGPGRIHFYRDVRPDYFEQILAEVKVPSGKQGKKKWLAKAGKRNEALDCEVYALHAARSLRLDQYTEARWTSLELVIMQGSLFGPDGPSQEDERENEEGDQVEALPVANDEPPPSSEAPSSPPAAVAEVQTSALVQEPTPAKPYKPQPPARRPIMAPRRPGFATGWK
ncbi:MAG: phage terminase large subunit family protein [Planctomycetes bacterium]|nr:phage terminase large subunit family protein [Planctomycetota bacterium]